MPEKFSPMRNPADLSGSADSLRENQDSSSLKQLNYRVKQRENQRKFHDKIDVNDHQKADSELENALSSLNVFTNEKELQETKNKDLDVNDKLTIKQEIKNYTESLKGEKSHQEILRLLIAKFKNENGVETLINNFRNYQRLYQFAENKPPKERRAIERIINNADLSAENSFGNSIAEISKSEEISETTKLEISRNFSGAHIDSVNGMDYQLKQVKEHTKTIEKEIGKKSSEKKSLDSEIDDLESELTNLPLDSPKRQELEDKIEQKKELLENTENEIDRLEKGKPRETMFVLREGFSAKLNPDGSRSIKIDENFTIKIPSHRLPFTTTRNLRTINLAFPYKILRDLHIADTIFLPNLENNAVPNKSQRDMGHLILSSLGIDDTKILSEENIKQLKKDLSFLNPQNGKSGQEHLIELGVYDVGLQSVDKIRLTEVLRFIRENRGLTGEIILKNISTSL